MYVFNGHTYTTSLYLYSYYSTIHTHTYKHAVTLSVYYLTNLSNCNTLSNPLNEGRFLSCLMTFWGWACNTINIYHTPKILLPSQEDWIRFVRMTPCFKKPRHNLEKVTQALITSFLVKHIDLYCFAFSVLILIHHGIWYSMERWILASESRY